MDRAQEVFPRLFSLSLYLQYVALHGPEDGREYVIYRTTKTISVYAVRAHYRVHTGETKEVSFNLLKNVRYTS